MKPDSEVVPRRIKNPRFVQVRTLFGASRGRIAVQKKETRQNDANKQIFKQQIIWRERPNRTLGHRDTPAKRWQHPMVERKSETQWRLASVWEPELG